MSRLGKLPVNVPSGVEVEIKPGSFRAKGPKGEVIEHLAPGVKVELEGQVINVSVNRPEEVDQRARWGLVRQLVANAVHGAALGFIKKLELSGVGYRAQLEGKELVLNLGFSHPIRYSIPADVSLTVEKNTITISGASKQRVGQVASDLRSFKEPEPYKGKGIRYSDEVVRRKAGKVVKAAGAK